jgi:hypothetical protein
LRQNVDRALHRGAVEVSREARDRAPKAFGVLTDAIIAKRVDWNEYHIVAGVNYAHAIEYGLPPGRMPPHRPLLAWVKAKRIGNRGEEDNTAYVIRRSIADRGTRPQPFMRPALNVFRSRLRELVINGLSR